MQAAAGEWGGVRGGTLPSLPLALTRLLPLFGLQVRRTAAATPWPPAQQ